MNKKSNTTDNPYKGLTIGQVIDKLAATTTTANSPTDEGQKHILSQNLKNNISSCCFVTMEFIPNKTYKRCRCCGACYEAS